MFGRYQIVRVLGEGGMGVVYEAIHPGLKKRFAIKTLLPSVAEAPSVRARFLREGEATARVDHPHIVDVVDVGEQDGVPFLVMEYLEGQTLAELLFASRGRLEVADALDILLPVLSAVAAGHAQGVVHRDLKPANIFLTQTPWGERFPKVLDFGVSKLLGDAQGGNVVTGTLTLLGTAAYMSPEQARNAKKVDGRSDQYSLGLILYEVLTGQRAHEGQHQLEVLHNVANGTFKAPRQVRPELPIAIEQILLRMLALEPDARYPTLLDVGRALLPHAGEKARIRYSDAFLRDARAGDDGKATRPGQPSAARPVESAATTTFREAAAELSAAASAVTRARRGRLAAMMALAGAAAGAAVGFGIIGRSSAPVAPAPQTAVPAATVPAPPVSAPPAPPAPPATEKPSTPPSVAAPIPAAPAPAAPAAATPVRHVHRKKGVHAATPAAEPAVARPAVESPKRGANNALIIK